MSLLIACGLTVAVETVFFYAVGRRKPLFLLLCAAANAATNLALNLLLLHLAAVGADLALLIYPLEAAVVLLEFFIFSAYEKGGEKLLFQAFLANALSYGIGVGLFGHL